MKNKQLGLLVLIAFVVKTAMALTVELNNDEVYYWTYAQQLQLNYFDHPPGIALLLRLGTFNLFFQQEFFLRLGSMLCSAISVWLIYLIGKRVKNERAGFIAALLFTASPYCSIIAGWLVIPDAPQLMFWLWSVLLMLKAIEPLQRTQKMRRRLLMIGVAIGCCTLCKVHGIFLWLGFFSYVLFYQRKILKDQFLFYSGFITVILISPIIYWNVLNNFITYRYHSSRVSFFSAIHPDAILREFTGEIIYSNPVSFAILILVLVTVFRKQRFMPLSSQRLLLLVSFPLIITVLFISLFRDTLPHWTGPAYATLIPLMSAYLAEKQIVTKELRVPAPVKWAIGFTIVLLVPAFITVKFLPVNIGKKDALHLGEGDPTLDMNGFKQFGVQFDSLYRHDVKEGLMGQRPFLIADCWFPAAHIDYYVARPNELSFLAIGDLKAIHHYAWLNQSRTFLAPGNDAYFITVSNYFNPPSPALTSQFGQLSAPVMVTQYRSGIAVRHFIIYRLRNYKGNIPGNGVLTNN